MNAKSFDLCSLPEVCFQDYGKGIVPVEIKKESDYDDNFISKKHEGRTDEIWLHLADEYKDLDLQEKMIKKRKEQVKKSLIGMCATQNSTGGGIHLEKCVRKGSVLYSEIPELKNVDLDKYRDEPIEYWKITEI